MRCLICRWCCVFEGLYLVCKIRLVYLSSLKKLHKRWRSLRRLSKARLLEWNSTWMPQMSSRIRNRPKDLKVCLSSFSSFPCFQQYLHCLSDFLWLGETRVHYMCKWDCLVHGKQTMCLSSWEKLQKCWWSLHCLPKARLLERSHTQVSQMSSRIRNRPKDLKVCLSSFSSFPCFQQYLHCLSSDFLWRTKAWLLHLRQRFSLE